MKRKWKLEDRCLANYCNLFSSLFFLLWCRISFPLPSTLDRTVFLNFPQASQHVTDYSFRAAPPAVLPFSPVCVCVFGLEEGCFWFAVQTDEGGRLSDQIWRLRCWEKNFSNTWKLYSVCCFTREDIIREDSFFPRFASAVLFSLCLIQRRLYLWMKRLASFSQKGQ